MRKSLHIGLAVFSFLLAHCTWSQDLPRSVAKPVFEVGDRWVFERIDQWKKEVQWQQEITVTAVEGGQVQLREVFLQHRSNPSGVGQPRNASHDDSLNRSSDPKRKNYDFPLSIGKSWTTDLVLPTENLGGETRYTGVITVVGWEKQTVGQKQYDALKFEYRGKWIRTTGPQPGSGRVEYDRWYVPELRAMTRLDYRSYSPADSLYWTWSDVLISADVKKR